MVIFPSFLAPGEGEFRAAGRTAENGVEAVLRYSSVSVQSHSAEDLLQEALSIHCCREAARPGGGSGGVTEHLQSVHLCGAGNDGDR